MVFDVDGVLVDTAASYNEAVVRTVRWLLPDAPVDHATVALWKRSGDWNNDWDLAYGLYCWLRAPERTAGATAAGRSLADLVAAAGPRAERSYAVVRGVFEEHYNGTERAVARYGVQPLVGNAEPLADQERIVLEPRHLVDLRATGVQHFGVVTGRVRADWEQIAPRLPLPRGTPVATDEDGRKPDPAGLILVLGRLRTRAYVYIGDTLNDLRLVQAHTATSGIPGQAVILCDASDERSYRAAGATVFVRSLGELADKVRALRPAAPRY
ncbi:MAG TPA: HAD family hydrolase [Candidatus Saccharimonadales bacterium]|nr:HAD family hydrolase [Candidatus Saccharimonadales bacterium]